MRTPGSPARLNAGAQHLEQGAGIVTLLDDDDASANGADDSVPPCRRPDCGQPGPPLARRVRGSDENDVFGVKCDTCPDRSASQFHAAGQTFHGFGVQHSRLADRLIRGGDDQVFE